MFEKGFVAVVALICIVLLVRLCLGSKRQQRFDAVMLRLWFKLRWTTMRLARWPAQRRAASRAAEAAIQRARGTVDREGNVYRPKSFRRPRKPH